MLRTEYWTPRPPVYEVMAFPNPVGADRTEIEQFKEWGRFESIKKRPREKIWDLKGKGYNNETWNVKPGDRFYSPVGQTYESARRFDAYRERQMQEVDWSRVEFMTTIGEWD